MEEPSTTGVYPTISCFLLEGYDRIEYLLVHDYLARAVSLIIQKVLDDRPDAFRRVPRRITLPFPGNSTHETDHSMRHIKITSSLDFRLQEGLVPIRY